MATWHYTNLHIIIITTVAVNLSQTCLALFRCHLWTTLSNPFRHWFPTHSDNSKLQTWKWLDAKHWL